MVQAVRGQVWKMGEAGLTLAPHHKESHPGRLCRATTILQAVSLSCVGHFWILHLIC